jgi:hypothetical protein
MVSDSESPFTNLEQSAEPASLRKSDVLRSHDCNQHVADAIVRDGELSAGSRTGHRSRNNSPGEQRKALSMVGRDSNVLVSEYPDMETSIPNRRYRRSPRGRRARGVGDDAKSFMTITSSLEGGLLGQMQRHRSEQTQGNISFWRRLREFRRKRHGGDSVIGYQDSPPPVWLRLLWGRLTHLRPDSLHRHLRGIRWRHQRLVVTTDVPTFTDGTSLVVMRQQ